MNWKQFILIILVVAFYVLHQDFWNWRETAPIILGFLPIGFFYHICYTIAVSLLMWLLVKYAWPAHLEAGEWESGGAGESGREQLPHSQAPAIPHSSALPLSRSQQTEDSE